MAPVLAICFMSRMEEPVLARTPLMYCEYVDCCSDCCTTASTHSESDECFQLLSRLSPHIRFTRNSKERLASYLNTWIKVPKGTFSLKWFLKARSKNGPIQATSVPVLRAWNAASLYALVKKSDKSHCEWLQILAHLITLYGCMSWCRELMWGCFEHVSNNATACSRQMRTEVV